MSSCRRHERELEDVSTLRSQLSSTVRYTNYASVTPELVSKDAHLCHEVRPRERLSTASRRLPCWMSCCCASTASTNIAMMKISTEHAAPRHAVLDMQLLVKMSLPSPALTRNISLLTSPTALISPSGSSSPMILPIRTLPVMAGSIRRRQAISSQLLNKSCLV
jgi:hypothetical protein